MRDRLTRRTRRSHALTDDDLPKIIELIQDAAALVQEPYFGLV
jgi:hypothetical protein